MSVLTPPMSVNDMLALCRQIVGQSCSHEDDKVSLTNFLDNDNCWNWRVVLKTDPPATVYIGGEWGGTWIHAEYHPGKWCEYLRDAVLPWLLVERRRKALGQQVSKEQDEARRFAPVDDAALFD